MLITRLLDQVAPRSYDATQIVKGLRELDWQTDSAEPMALVQTYLSRLHRQGKIERIGKGKYRSIRRQQEGPAEAGPSSGSLIPSLMEGGDAR